VAFHENLQKYIAEHKIIVPQIPVNYVIPKLKKPLKDLEFSTPETYSEFLENEKSFWQEQAKTFPHFSKYVQHYTNAISSLTAANQNPQNVSYSQQNLNNSIGYAKNAPYHNTILAKELVRLGTYGARFFEGFLECISSVETTYNNYNLSKDYVKGIFAGLNYQELVKEIDFKLPDNYGLIENAQADALNKINSHVAEYDKQVKEKTKQYEKLGKDANDFIAKTDGEFKQLKKVYEEDLKLKAPAKYWEAMSKSYGKKGMWFLIASGVISVLSIASIITLVLILPNMSESEHWFDYFKVTASFTIVSAITIYVLRIAVKMAMSSYHLSRDAKEREQLTYFYLALIQEKGVDPKERELILKSLFSRSNTGLIKGDDAPEIPLNITDFMKGK
jgi:hypothetical protein